MKLKRLFVGFVLGLVIVLFSGCGKSDVGIRIDDVWGRPGLGGGNSAIFFVVHNDGLNDVRIISAFSDVAEAAELHKSSMVDGVMKMELQEDIVIPAGGEVIFKPGDFHVMLIDLHDDMVVGEKFEAGLVLESGEEIKLNVVVKEP